MFAKNEKSVNLNYFCPPLDGMNSHATAPLIAEKGLSVLYGFGVLWCRLNGQLFTICLETPQSHW